MLLPNGTFASRPGVAAAPHFSSRFGQCPQAFDIEHDLVHAVCTFFAESGLSSSAGRADRRLR
jgi:hypothetical protein